MSSLSPNSPLGADLTGPTNAERQSKTVVKGSRKHSIGVLNLYTLRIQNVALDSIGLLHGCLGTVVSWHEYDMVTRIAEGADGSFKNVYRTFCGSCLFHLLIPIVKPLVSVSFGRL